ncbi:MAG: hypothetical protein IT282_17430 [Bacteroidetes bacterium]|nr:hypothetical protein [Bacteroidota bacterium]
MPEHLRIGGKEIVYNRMLLCRDDQDVHGSVQIGSLAVPFTLKICELPNEHRFKVSINPTTLAITIEMAKSTEEENVVTVFEQPVIEVRGGMLSLMFWSQRIGAVNAVLLQFLHESGA